LNFLGPGLALLSGLVWGGGDFVGGVASRRAKSAHVLIFGSMAGFALMVILALVWGESFPDARSIGWGLAAGSVGMIGLAALYHGLSRGHAGVVAPVSTVLAQAIPVIYFSLGIGLPKPTQLLGFGLALVGGFLISRGVETSISRAALPLGVLSGFGFGSFFVVISWTGEANVFGSLAAARVATISTCLLMLLLQRDRLAMAAASPAAFLSGVLDAIGNALYMIAKQFTRPDVAVVLGSLYPVSTIVLSRLIYKERISRLQAFGIALCAVAVAFIVA
jgi:drug/metabolite transporter (DMT)-like permease